MALIETEVGWERAEKIYEEIKKIVRFRRLIDLMAGASRGLEMGYYAGIMHCGYLPFKACPKTRKKDFRSGFILAYRAGFKIGKEWHNKA